MKKIRETYKENKGNFELKKDIREKMEELRKKHFETVKNDLA
jgi:hypothetical protein